MDRILEIAESLGQLPKVLLEKYAPLNFALPPPEAEPEHEIAPTADEDEDGRLPLALDISSSSAEEDAEQRGGGQGNERDENGERELPVASEPDEDEGELPVASEPIEENGDEDNAPRYSRRDKGKGRATAADIESPEADEEGTPHSVEAEESARATRAEKGKAGATGLGLDDILGGEKRGGNSDFAAAIFAAVNAAASGGDYFSTIGQWLIPEIEDEDSLPPEDLIDKQLALLEEAVRRTLGALPPEPPAQDGPAHDFDFDLHQVKGCTGAEMRRIADRTRERAEKARKIAHDRAQLERSFHFLCCQAEHMSMLDKVVASKRLWLEMQMARFKKIFRKPSKGGKSGGGRGGHDGDDGGHDGGAGGSRSRPAGRNDEGEKGSGEDDRRAGNDANDEHQENEDGEEEDQEILGGSDKENEVVPDKGKAPTGSTTAKKTVAPPVAAGQRAAQRMVRRLQRMSSAPTAGPSTSPSQTAPAAPALLPAWDADAHPRPKTGWESSSDSASSPPPVPPTAASPRRNPITPPTRSSAPMRRNMESGRRVLAELPDLVARLATASAAGRMLDSSPLAGLPQGGAARRVGLSGAFSLDQFGGNSSFGSLFFGSGPPPVSPRAGESISQCMPRARRQLVEGGAGGSVSFLSRGSAREDEYDE